MKKKIIFSCIAIVIVLVAIHVRLVYEHDDFHIEWKTYRENVFMHFEIAYPSHAQVSEVSRESENSYAMQFGDGLVVSVSPTIHDQIEGLIAHNEDLGFKLSHTMTVDGYHALVFEAREKTAPAIHLSQKVVFMARGVVYELWFLDPSNLDRTLTSFRVLGP